MHRTASLRVARLLTTLIKDSKGFFWPGRPKPKGQGSASGAPWSRFPMQTSCHPPPPLLAPRTWLAHSYICWPPTSLSISLLHVFLHFSTLALFLLVLWGTNNPCLYRSASACNFTFFIYLFLFFLQAFSQLFLITSQFSHTSKHRLCSWAVLEQDLGSLEETQLNWVVQEEVTGQMQAEGVIVYREIDTTGLNFSLWHKCLDPA